MTDTDLFSRTETHLPSDRVMDLIADDHNQSQIETVAKALGSSTRLAILRLLGAHTCSVLDIAEALNLPQSTATLHVNILEKAGLIKTDLLPAKRGLQKICARTYDRIRLQLPTATAQEEATTTISMPLGAYVDANVTPTCGLVGELGIIGQLDDPATLYDPQHIYAQLIWFRKGYVEYRFPNRLPPKTELENLELSFEVCSEAPLHHSDWPSDITVWINGKEIGTWTSPADFGGEHGALTPDWWDNNNSQFGLLKVWKVTSQGSYVDGVSISQATLGDLKVGDNQFISVRIGVKADAQHVGGINLFGSKFGNYPQDIVLKMRYKNEIE